MFLGTGGVAWKETRWEARESAGGGSQLWREPRGELEGAGGFGESRDEGSGWQAAVEGAGKRAWGSFEGSRGGNPGGWTALEEVEKRARGGRQLWRKPGRELRGKYSSGRRALEGGYL